MVGEMARVRVDVSAADPVMDWRDVHGPARAVAYAMVGAADPELARQLHDEGWDGSSLRPVGISPPMFTGAVSRRGIYTTSGTGSVWFGSPVPKIAGALLRGLAGLQELRWGSALLTVRGTDLELPPDFRNGLAEFSTVSPVLVKKESRFLLPDDDAFTERLEHNLRHKADVLGLPSGVEVSILEAGPRRVFDVAGAKRVGATVRLRVAADPALLGALWEWGVGLCTVQGFGWLK
jgi:CRISPR-associated endoribonuclease Cas6